MDTHSIDVLATVIQVVGCVMMYRNSPKSTVKKNFIEGEMSDIIVTRRNYNFKSGIFLLAAGFIVHLFGQFYGN